MPRIRPSSTTRTHSALGDAAVAWASLDHDGATARYALPYGVTHLVAAGRIDEASALTTDFEAQLTRRRVAAESDVARYTTHSTSGSSSPTRNVSSPSSPAGDACGSAGSWRVD